MGMLRIGTLMVVGTLVAGLSACGSSSAPPSSGGSTAPLVGTSWLLTSYLDATGEPAVPAAGSQTPTIAFTDVAVSGSTGCNRFTGTYTQDGTAVAVSVGPVTKMACPGAVGAQETAILTGLGKVAVASTSGTTLVLQDAGGAALLTYEQGAAGLEGTAWTATGINNGQGAVVSDAGTASVTASFGADGVVSGNGGCNSYSGPWTTSGSDGVTIGPVASTQMACDLLETEQQYFLALAEVTTYQLEGDTLTLRDAQGATQVTFTAG